MKKIQNQKINVIGAGLAGCEAAYLLARYGFQVSLYEMKPNKMTPAHKSSKFGELVCSNSLKSTKLDNACGLLKEEMKVFSSLVMEASEHSSIPGGSSLNVDREKFSEYIDDKIKTCPNITIVNSEVSFIDKNEITIICVGPLGTKGIVDQIKQITGDESLAFFDASAPIIYSDSIDKNIAYFKSRFDEGEATYLNCPMNREQYYNFVNELINAKCAPLHDFDTNYFEGCMPVEVMAKRGIDTLRFGPLKPRGLEVDGKEKPYAVVQLRQDSLIGDLYNIVGFQTNLIYSEQKRVFSLIPGLENANYARYGLMHRNTFINAPKCLNVDLSLKECNNIYIAGQFCGVEGYVESAASGIYAAINVLIRMLDIKAYFTRFTMLGSLINYICNGNPNSFSPMNANFGIMYGVNKKNKIEKAEQSICECKEFLRNLNEQTRS